jgi:hypothetical protein
MQFNKSARLMGQQVCSVKTGRNGDAGARKATQTLAADADKAAQAQAAAARRAAQARAADTRKANRALAVDARKVAQALATDARKAELAAEARERELETAARTAVRAADARKVQLAAADTRKATQTLAADAHKAALAQAQAAAARRAAQALAADTRKANRALAAGARKVAQALATDARKAKLAAEARKRELETAARTAVQAADARKVRLAATDARKAMLAKVARKAVARKAPQALAVGVRKAAPAAACNAEAAPPARITETDSASDSFVTIDSWSAGDSPGEGSHSGEVIIDSWSLGDTPGEGSHSGEVIIDSWSLGDTPGEGSHSGEEDAEPQDGDKLGQGASATVHAEPHDDDKFMQGASATVRDLGNGQVVKSVKKTHCVCALREINILNKLKHGNIVKLISFKFFPDGSANMVLGHGGRSLDRVRSDEPSWFRTGNRVLNLVHQLGQALAFLNKNDVAHMDIKMDNVLLGGDVYTLCDFGIAQTTTVLATEILGTSGYFAPEIAAPNALIKQADAFSFGALMLELIVGWEWFERAWVVHYETALLRGASQCKKRSTALAEALAKGLNCAINDQTEGMTKLVVRILRGLLQVDTRLRWTSKRAADAAFAELRTGN